jgi:type IV secretory pathway VirB4 component
VAAAFPYVYKKILDPNGFNVGTAGGAPVFINFFQRDYNRVNSNMVIIGKSGGGKSYATKTILSNLAAEDSKIFILDPENEYQTLAANLKGKIIDAGSATQGRLNPFHIIASAEDEEGGEEGNTSFNMHLQFLEEFFKMILPGINTDSMEYLNNILIRLYDDRGIDSTSDLSALSPSDFPIFDDLYDKILIDYQKAEGDYSKENLRTLINYVSKFASGGRNSALWNGEATISTNENFIVFNFQTLLANKNNTIANAQMLLVLKWLDNEIIKNRDYNLKHDANRKIIIAIDEAHVFIDPKFPIALDFMYQLAKRIRKYNGMQIIITQNIKDFVGSEEIAKKSTGIINACQYSFIFPLAPNDMHDLCKLYEKAGAINESEQEEIITNGRGRAFVITTPTDRTSINIVASPEVKAMFTLDYRN